MKRPTKLQLRLKMESIRTLKEVQLEKVAGGIGCNQSGSCSDYVVTCGRPCA